MDHRSVLSTSWGGRSARRCCRFDVPGPDSPPSADRSSPVWWRDVQPMASRQRWPAGPTAPGTCADPSPRARSGSGIGA